MRSEWSLSVCCFFFNDTATTEIYTLSLHDALPICKRSRLFKGSCSDGLGAQEMPGGAPFAGPPGSRPPLPPRRIRSPLVASDRKSTRLNSSHANISYAVFCLKKKKNTQKQHKSLHI